MPFALEKLALVDIPVLHVLLALALLQVAHKLTLISVAVVRNHFTVAAGPIIDELSLIDISIGEDQFSVTGHFIIEEGAFVDVLVGPRVLASSLHDSFVHFSFVDITIFEIVFACAMLLAIAGLAFVYAVIVFDGFLQKLQGISNFLFTEDFLWQILQLPEDDFEGTFRNFVGGYIWKLSIVEQDIQFFDGESPIIVSLEFLYSLNALVNILLPGRYFVHDLLHVLNIVGLIVNLPQGLNVVLSLVDKETITRFSVFLEFVDGFVDLCLEVCADSFDEFVEFDEIVVFPQPFFDFVVVRPGGPVVHFPQILFLQFFEGDEIVLAFLMGEFCEAYRAKERAFLAVVVEADDFDLFVLMLFVHARNL